MGIYLGYVEVISKNGNYFNFYPLYEKTEDMVFEMNHNELEDLLPGSEFKSINLYFRNNPNMLMEMEEFFIPDKLYYFELNKEDLEDNINRNTEKQHRTGYKYDGYNNRGVTIFPAEEKNVFPILSKKDLIIPEGGSFYEEKRCDLDQDQEGYAIAGNHQAVYVEVDGFVTGPYTTWLRDYDDSRYIELDFSQNNYIMQGYKRENINFLVINVVNYSNPSQILYLWENPQKLVYCDVLYNKKDFVQYFLQLIQHSKYIKNGMISTEDFTNLAEEYENMQIKNDIPRQIVESRLERLRNFLQSEGEVAGSLQETVEIWLQFLETHKGEEMVLQLMEELVKSHPNFAEALEKSSHAQDEIEYLKDEVYQLNEEICRQNKEIEFLDKEVKTNTALNMTQSLSDEIRGKQEELGELRKKLEELLPLDQLVTSKESLKQEVSLLEQEKIRLEQEKFVLKQNTEALQDQFSTFLKTQKEEMVGIAFHGFVANQMTSAAANWQTQEDQRNFDQSLQLVNSMVVEDLPPEDLIDYLVSTIKTVRPKYSENDIINIAICITQGFLTIFSGEPGSGKTSICNIWADVLGLNNFNHLLAEQKPKNTDLNRYVPVSVGRGWTSKRDFIGYFNPLSKNFDKTNTKMFDALQILSMEKELGMKNFPLYVLLDEANLSPMEYYWADFMNVCDQLDENSSVNLNENYIFRIPETLHFLATINNDHTTEMLSPRLIDRSWIIMLPQGSRTQRETETNTLNPALLKQITWNSIEETFLSKKNSDIEKNKEANKVYQSILTTLWEAKIQISPRTQIAVEEYLAVASRHLKKERDNYSTEPMMIALDYAVSQRILPKISGSGDGFRQSLLDLQNLCKTATLYRSARILEEILERGDKQMKYYRFF